MQARRGHGGRNAKFVFPSAVRWLDIYQWVWGPCVRQRLGSEREHGNKEDRITVADIQNRSRDDEHSDA